MSNLFDRWNELERNGGPGTSQRVLPTGLPQYLSLDGNGRWAFLTTLQFEPRAWPEIRLVEISKREVGGVWQFALTLREESFKHEFAYLCADLVTESAKYEVPELAFSSQEATYLAWLEFFRSAAKFSEESARGLFGELTYMLGRIQNGESPDLLVEAWKGPVGAPQDFVFDEFNAVEIKTLQPQGRFIKIAAENQLDFPGSLFLHVYRIQEQLTRENGSNLLDLVAKVEATLSGTALRDFRLKLAKLGYKSDLPIISENFYAMGASMTFFASDPSFPKITPINLPLGISRVEYRIQLDALQGKEFEVSGQSRIP